MFVEISVFGNGAMKQIKQIKQDSETIQSFLSSVGPMVAASEAARLQVARRAAPHFTSFKFMTLDENKLSDIISHFLNPKAEHGQGDAFLKILLQRIGLKGAKTDKVSVKREASAGSAGGFIDILVEAPDWRVVIENKPWAGDQRKQLERYWDHVTRAGFNPSKCRIVYLSANGQIPSTYSLGKQLRAEISSEPSRLFGLSLGPENSDNVEIAPYPVLPFETIILEWISAARPNHVRGFLDEFCDYLNHNFGDPEDAMREQSEALAQMIRQSREMTVAALHTSDAVAYMKKEIRNDFFRALEDAILARLGERAEFSERISNTDINYRSFRFWLASDKRPDLVHAMLELERNGSLIFGVRAPGAAAPLFKNGSSDKEPVSEETRERLSEAVKNSIPNPRRSKWWASYTYITSEWPNLNTTKGMLFMLDGLERSDDPTGPVAEMAEQAAILANSLYQFFE